MQTASVSDCQCYSINLGTNLNADTSSAADAQSPDGGRYTQGVYSCCAKGEGTDCCAGKQPLFSVFAMRADDGDGAATAVVEPPLVVRDQAGQRTRDFIAVREVLGMPP